jgi:hypothetical protein
LGVILSNFGETDIRLFCEMDLSQPKEILVKKRNEKAQHSARAARADPIAFG